MTDNKPSHLKKLWILPPLVLGIVIFMVMKSGSQPPTLTQTGEAVRVVRTMTLETTDFVPVAKGYGTVQPAQIWKAIAQVSGRVTKMHQRLKDGAIIQQGELLFQIDPVDYELNLAQSETQLAELDVQKTNTQSSLKIEQKNLSLANKELNRLQKLLKQGSVSKSSVDAAERTVLSSSAQVQNLKNSLSLIPSQKKLQQAKITQAERDLSNTRVTAPFNLRVADLTIEKDQYVSKGQALFSGDSVDRVEIVAQVAMSSLKNLFSNRTTVPTDIQSLSSNLSTITGFKPTVKLDMGQHESASWQAEFIRFSDRVDSQTRTMGIVVAVDNPMQKIIPGSRPPLSKGMFVEVEIAGHIQTNSLIVPGNAIRNGKAYVMNKENRLEIREVHKLYDQGYFSVIKNGLSPGEKLVLTDIIPAVKGMLLKSTETSANTGQ